MVDNTCICPIIIIATILNMFDLPEATETRSTVFSLPNANLYRISGDKKNVLSQNQKLEIFLYPNQKLHVLSIELLRYSLNNKMPIVREQEKYVYTFPDVDSRFRLELPPDTPEETIKYFEDLLHAQSSFIVNIPPPPPEPNFLARAIYRAANFLKWSILRAGSLFTASLAAIGNYVYSLIPSRKEEVKIPAIAKTVHGAKEAAQSANVVKGEAIEYSSEKVSEKVVEIAPGLVKQAVGPESQNFFVQTGKATYRGAVSIFKAISEVSKSICNNFHQPEKSTKNW